MLSIFLILFFYAFLGHACYRLHIISERQTKRIVDIVMYITMPMVIAFTFVQHPLDQTHLFLIFFGVVSMVLILLILYILLLPYKKNSSTFGTALNLAFFSNAGYLGIPLVYSLYGSEGLAISVPYQLFSHGVVGVFTCGVFIFDFFKQKEKTSIFMKLKKAIYETIKTPVFLAIPAGVILSKILPWQLVADFSNVVSSINTFCIVFAVGAMLRPERFSRQLAIPTAYITFLCLFVTPALTFILGRLIGLSPYVLSIITTVSAMPTAVINIILAREYEMAVDLAESVLVVSTILSLVTLPIVVYFFSNFNYY